MTAAMSLAALLLVSAGSLETNTRFQEAKAFYLDLEFEQAIVKFRLASADASLSNADQATIQLWIGTTYGGLGDNETARRSFADAYAFALDAELPDLTPPSLRTIANEEREKAKMAAQAASDSTANKASSGAMGPAATEASAQNVSTPGETQSTEPSIIPQASDGLPWLLIGGGASVALGAIAVAITGGFSAWGASNFLFASDKAQFQDEADAAAQAMNIGLLGAGVTGALAVALLGAGVTLVVTDFVLE